LVGVSLYFYSEKEAEQWNLPESNITISGIISSEDEIKVDMSLNILRPLKEVFGQTEGGSSTWKEYMYTNANITISGAGINTQTISKDIGDIGGVHSSLILQLSSDIPNFLFEEKNSYTLHLSLEYTNPSWLCTKIKLSSGSWTEYGDCICPHHSAYRNSDSWNITVNTDEITNPNGIYKIYEEPFPITQIYDFQLTYRETDILVTFRTVEDIKPELYTYSFGKYVFHSKISNAPKRYHEIVLPLENAKYKIKVWKIVENNFYSKILYVEYKEFETVIPDIPQINIEVTRHSIIGDKLEVRFRIENETDKTEKHFYYREVGHGINDPKVSKLGNEYGIELTLKNGNYEYWIYAKEGDQEKTTDKVPFTINVTEEGLKFTKGNEEIKQTSYGLEFELSEKINNVYYTYKKKDEPVSALKEGSIPRFGNEYNFSIRNLTPDTLYELDIFAESEKVYSIEFRTLFTQETPPPTTPPEEDEGFTISSFFILIGIIVIMFYYIYSKLKKGGKK